MNLIPFLEVIIWILAYYTCTHYSLIIDAQITAISINVVGSELQAFATRPNGSMGRSRRLLHVPNTYEV